MNKIKKIRATKITKKMKYKALREFILSTFDIDGGPHQIKDIKRVIEVLDNTSVAYFTSNKKEVLRALKVIFKQIGESR